MLRIPRVVLALGLVAVLVPLASCNDATVPLDPTGPVVRTPKPPPTPPRHCNPGTAAVQQGVDTDLPGAADKCDVEPL